MTAELLTNFEKQRTFRYLFQDPCSRAWISSIIKGGVGTSPSSSVIQSSACTLSPSHRKANNRCLGQHHVMQRIRSLDPDVFSERKNISDLCPLTHTMSGTFLVCVHNVSKNQPYVILRASINSTADDIIKEVFLKSQQTNVTESEYVLVEEIVKGKSSLLTGALEPSTPGNVILFGEKNVEVAKHFDCKNVSLRVLASNEIVWKAQSAWKTSGRFILENREHTVHSTREKVRNLLQALEDAHISAGSPSPVKR
ncbi:1-phosphatidylinositol 4,5-bisphosphate phosphodiesterase epsilon-1 [Dirofilaria immitis]